MHLGSQVKIPDCDIFYLAGFFHNAAALENKEILRLFSYALIQTMLDIKCYVISYVFNNTILMLSNLT